MSFIGDIVDAISGAVGSVTSILDPILAPINQVIGGANGTIQGSESAVSAAIQAESNLTGNALITLIGSILNTLDTGVRTLSDTVGQFIKPITDTVHSINQLAQDIEGGLIQPIIGPIVETVTTIQQLEVTIHDLVDRGISGILQIPGAIADALSGVDASFERSTRQLAEVNAGLASNVFAPSIRDAGRPGFTMLHDAFAAYAAPRKFHVSPTDHVALSHDADIAELSRIYKGRVEGLTFQGEVGEGLIRGLLTVAASIAFAYGALDNIRELGQEKANEAVPVAKLDAATAVEAARRGIITDEAASRELAAKGLDPTRQSVLFDLAKVVLDPALLDELLKRRLIDPGDYDTSLTEQGYSGDEILARKAALEQLFDAGTLLDLAARGAVDETNVRRIFSSQGFIPEAIDALLETAEAVPPYPLAIGGWGNRTAAGHGFFAETYGSPPPDIIVKQGAAARRSADEVALQWQGHWAKLSVGLAVQAFFRGLLNRNEMDYVVEQNDLPPAMTQTLIDAQRPILTRRVIATLLASNSIDENTARDELAKEGWPPKILDALIHNALAARGTSKAATAKAAVDLSLSAAETAFRDGIIDEATFRSLLAAHRLDKQAIDVTVQLAKIKEADAEQKAFVADLTAQVELGTLTVADAQQQAAQAGLAPSQIVKIVRSLHASKAKAAKLPTLAELVRMVKKSVIDQATFSDTLASLGYSRDWIARFVVLEFGPGG